MKENRKWSPTVFLTSTCLWSNTFRWVVVLLLWFANLTSALSLFQISSLCCYFIFGFDVLRIFFHSSPRYICHLRVLPSSGCLVSQRLFSSSFRFLRSSFSRAFRPLLSSLLSFVCRLDFRSKIVEENVDVLITDAVSEFFCVELGLWNCDCDMASKVLGLVIWMQYVSELLFLPSGLAREAVVSA